jgi:20S proteasome subunit beta 7
LLNIICFFFLSYSIVKQTQEPIVTGASILGLKYDGGVLLAADTLASYGSLARFRSVERLKAVGSSTLIGASGEYSDFQYIQKILEELIINDYNHADGIELTPSEIYQYLVRVMYQRRNKFDPLWNSLVVAGVSKIDNSTFLGVTDMVGTHWQDDSIATGFGNYLAQPLLRKFVDEKKRLNQPITENEAREKLIECMKVLWYRDARSLNRIQIARVDKNGTHISEPQEVETRWVYKGF